MDITNIPYYNNPRFDILHHILHNVKKVLALSTDKACAPINLYGATKLTSDKLFINAHLIKGKNKTIFSILVLGGSQGAEFFGKIIPPIINNRVRDH